MSRIDLHTHSRASDGSLRPSELVEAAAVQGVRQLGLTDHDTTDGLAEAAESAARQGIELVTGIELTTDDGERQADILGYFYDPEHAGLREILGRMREARVERAREMVDRLRRLGAELDYAAVAELAGSGVVTRPHVAHAMVASGFVLDVDEAFRRYIARGRPAFVDRYRLTPPAACELIRAAGGVPVLAHPVPNGNPYSDPLRLRSFLPGLVEAGLGGLECYYWRYTRRVNRWLEALAWHHRLVPSGGSDYHGPWRANRLGAVEVPEGTVERLRAAAEAGR
ncbi:MAG: PHP domain-containing protein [Caldilineae bacterium]|nr:PHP domain-containing protein [Chloroflexota bacterium]MCB9177574.1 PHP domain-containing protein [Caldilineae bacterium]